MNCLKAMMVCLLTLSLYSGCTSSTAPTPVQSTTTSAAGEEAKPRNSMMGDPPAEAP